MFCFFIFRFPLFFVCFCFVFVLFVLVLSSFVFHLFVGEGGMNVFMGFFFRISGRSALQFFQHFRQTTLWILPTNDNLSYLDK